MVNDDGSGRYESLPIPTYEEAISSRPNSSHQGPQEISDDAERQGLLGQASSRNPGSGDGYHAPTAESARSSTDSDDLYLPEVTGEGEAASLRRTMEELEVEDPLNSIRPSAFSKHFPTFRYITSRLPSFPSFPRAWSCPTPHLPKNLAVSIPIIARLFGLGLIALFIYLLFSLNLLTGRSGMGRHYDPESVRARVQQEVSAERIAGYMRYLTSFDHVAGTEGDLYMARWMAEKMQGAGMEMVRLEEFEVYMNYPTPTGRRVSIVEPKHMQWDAVLEEENVFRATGQVRQQTLNWQGLSRNGSATGHLVFANGGSREDFETLKEMGVKVEGSVVLVRQFGSQTDTGLKVKAAELAGAVACLIFSDPADDGIVRGAVSPDGPWRSEDSVQRGSVGLRNWVLGDVLTPGDASEPGVDRKAETDNPGLVNITSMALSWRDARKLILALNAHGHEVPPGWAGGTPDSPAWFTGDENSPQVLVQNFQDENKLQKIWNVRGIIKGIESMDRVIVGSHRDAWCFGAAESASGSAVMAEIISIFGTLRKLGWRPLRSIEFFNWDGSEQNLIGSTEHVEKYADFLRAQGVGYINVGAAVTGGTFRADCSPSWSAPLHHVLDRVKAGDGNHTVEHQYRERGGREGLLGAGGDYAAFQNIAGVSSIDIGFYDAEDQGNQGKRSYPANSCYDTFEWMEQFGDPNFQNHKALVEILALLILEAADRPIIPLNLQDLARGVKASIDDLGVDSKDTDLFLGRLYDAQKDLEEKIQESVRFEDYWTAMVMGRGGFEIDKLAGQRETYNTKLIRLESDLLDLPGMFDNDDKEQHGVPGREQYKHVIFGPQLWSTSGSPTFPAVRDALEAKDTKLAQQQVDKAARIIKYAAQKLMAQ